MRIIFMLLILSGVCKASESIVVKIPAPIDVCKIISSDPRLVAFKAAHCH